MLIVGTSITNKVLTQRVLKYPTFARIGTTSTAIAIYILKVPSFLLAFVVLYIKSTNDIFEGLSKLDYLLKISIF